MVDTIWMIEESKPDGGDYGDRIETLLWEEYGFFYSEEDADAKIVEVLAYDDKQYEKWLVRVEAEHNARVAAYEASIAQHNFLVAGGYSPTIPRAVAPRALNDTSREYWDTHTGSSRYTAVAVKRMSS